MARSILKELKERSLHHLRGGSVSELVRFSGRDRFVQPGSATTKGQQEEEDHHDGVERP